VVDFDAATADPSPAALGNMSAKYLPNSQFTQLPWDYLHPNHAGYNAMGLAVDIAPSRPPATNRTASTDELRLNGPASCDQRWRAPRIGRCSRGRRSVTEVLATCWLACRPGS